MGDDDGDRAAFRERERRLRPRPSGRRPSSACPRTYNTGPVPPNVMLSTQWAAPKTFYPGFDL